MLKFIKKIYHLKYLNKILYFIAKNTGFVDLNYHRIDGGLGSQIIGYLIYMEKKKNNPNAYCDTSFFYQSKTDNLYFNNLTFRNWQLDNLGVNLDSIPSIKKKSRLKLHPSIEDQGVIFLNFLEHGVSKNNYRSYFNLDLINLNNIDSSLQNFINNDYTAIHIRRGDFLKYSSLIIEDDEIISLIKSIKPIITNEVLIISDDFFDTNFSNHIMNILNTQNVKFISGGDEITIHTLLRNSKILVTSNSMFSLSAAILQKRNSISIIPKLFFGKTFLAHNNAIQSLTKWSFVTEKYL